MSKLSFEITRIDVKKKGNYFILVQLDETEFPSKLTRTQKFRTEIDYSTEFPEFHKNYFEFNNVQLGNKLVFRVGLFNFNNVNSITKEQKSSNKIPPRILFNNSTLIGSSDILMTPEWIEKIRKSKYVESDKILINPEINKEETGHCYFKIYCKSQTLDTKIYEDNKEIEDCYYDPFEKDEKKISEKFKTVVALNEEKQIDMEKMQKKYDETNNQVKHAAREKEEVKKSLKELEEENNFLRKNLAKLQNYDEIHIEIDLLSQSNQGVEMLQKKLAVLNGQIAIQRQIKNEYEKQYKEIENLMAKINIIKNRYELLKNANQELKFNYKVHEDMLPLVTTYEEKIKNNNKIIQNFKNNIQDVIDLKNKKSNLTLQEVNERIDMFEKERKKLEEKKLQLNLYLDVYFKDQTRDKTYNELREPFYRIIGNDPIMGKILCEGEEEVLANNQNKIKELQSIVDDLTTKINNFDQKEKEKKEKGIVIDPNLILKRNNLKEQVNTKLNKEQYLMEEIKKNKYSFLDAKEVLKAKIAHLDDIIERELKYARIRTYEEGAYANKDKIYYDDNMDYD